MNIKKSSKISNGVNYNNLNKVNLRERGGISDLREIIFKTIKQLRRIFYVGVFYFERSAQNPVRDKSLNGVN